MEEPQARLRLGVLYALDYFYEGERVLENRTPSQIPNVKGYRGFTDELALRCDDDIIAPRRCDEDIIFFGVPENVAQTHRVKIRVREGPNINDKSVRVHGGNHVKKIFRDDISEENILKHFVGHIAFRSQHRVSESQLFANQIDGLLGVHLNGNLSQVGYLTGVGIEFHLRLINLPTHKYSSLFLLVSILRCIGEISISCNSIF